MWRHLFKSDCLECQSNYSVSALGRTRLLLNRYRRIGTICWLLTDYANMKAFLRYTVSEQKSARFSSTESYLQRRLLRTSKEALFEPEICIENRYLRVKQVFHSVVFNCIANAAKEERSGSWQVYDAPYLSKLTRLS